MMGTAFTVGNFTPCVGCGRVGWLAGGEVFAFVTSVGVAVGCLVTFGVCDFTIGVVAADNFGCCFAADGDCNFGPEAVDKV